MDRDKIREVIENSEHGLKRLEHIVNEFNIIKDEYLELQRMHAECKEMLEELESGDS
jgi:chromosome condensin MukBEF ATPase and DNA-binding subunit MukB